LGAATPRTFDQMKLPRRPAAIVFDMDGLLFDAEALCQEAAILAAAEGGDDVSSGVFSQTPGLPWPQSRSVLLAHFGLSFPVEEFVATWVRHFEVIAATGLALKPGAIELLNTLDHLGLPRAIATSSARETVEHHLHFHDLVGRFHHIVGHGDYAVGKPAPDPFLKLPSFWVWNPGHVLRWQTRTTECDPQPRPA